MTDAKTSEIKSDTRTDIKTDINGINNGINTPILIAAACLLALLSNVGASLPYPILPPLFAADSANQLTHFLGLPSKLLFGIALSINPLGLLIGSALLGPLSDRYGRRPVLLITAIGAAVGHAVTALALVIESYPLFILARLITGLLEGNASVARALLADKLSGDQRIKALSWLNGAVYSGWLAGPLLAGLTIGWGITVPFWIAVAALLLSAGLIAIALPGDAASQAVTKWWEVARDKHAFNLLRIPELKKLFILQLAYTSGVTAFYEFYPLWLVEITHFGTREIAWMTAGLCALMTATSFFSGNKSRFQPLQRAAFYASFSALAIAALSIGHAQTGLIAIILFGIPNAYYNAILPAWSAERFGAHGQGAVMGLISVTFCLANILMALAGSVLSLLDTRLILLLGACLSAWAAWQLNQWQQQINSQQSTLQSTS